MTKDVLVSISGLHTDVMQEAEEENEAIEVVNPANYYFRNGKRALCKRACFIKDEQIRLCEHLDIIRAFNKHA